MPIKLWLFKTFQQYQIDWHHVDLFFLNSKSTPAYYEHRVNYTPTLQWSVFSVFTYANSTFSQINMQTSTDTQSLTDHLELDGSESQQGACLRNEGEHLSGHSRERRWNERVVEEDRLGKSPRISGF